MPWNPDGLTVLLVEDAEHLRRVIGSMLRKSGYNVLEAAHGGEALEVLTRDSKDVRLVITDVMMPEMTGTELAGHLAQLRPELPVLFMSGCTGDPILQNVQQVGACFLRKPFTSIVLIEAVRQLLNGHCVPQP
jgi:two-component system, cell cycle sensor histidine kinase and response regulator CckA